MRTRADVLRALEPDWNVSRAARAIGVHRQALQRDLRRWGGVMGLRDGGPDEKPPVPGRFKQATVVLTFNEWLWLRRRAEREAEAGGDATLRAAIKACITEAMAREKDRP